MTTSDTSTPITEAALEGELEILREEIAITERQLEDLRAQREAARQAHHEADEAKRAAEAAFVPLHLATKQDHDQAGIYAVGEYAQTSTAFVGDSMWAASFPECAQAWGQLEAAKTAATKASARALDLHLVVRDLERRKLPGLQTAAFDKQQELETFRANQQRAVETREATLKDTLDRFRRRLREKA